MLTLGNVPHHTHAYLLSYNFPTTPASIRHINNAYVGAALAARTRVRSVCTSLACQTAPAQLQILDQSLSSTACTAPPPVNDARRSAAAHSTARLVRGFSSEHLHDCDCSSSQFLRENFAPELTHNYPKCTRNIMLHI